MMTDEVADNILAVLDGADIATDATIRFANAAGAEKLSSAFIANMTGRGWSRGFGSKTKPDVMTTPHVTKWSTMTDGQRDAWIALTKLTIRRKTTEKPTTEATDGE
jgi:hypothetical protein